VPAPPKQIGPYAIGEQLGAGGMGTVYLAHHVESQQVAAVKVLPASMAHEAGFVARFEREIDSLKRLSNPHIIKLYDSGSDHDSYKAARIRKMTKMPKANAMVELAPEDFSCSAIPAQE